MKIITVKNSIIAGLICLFLGIINAPEKCYLCFSEDGTLEDSTMGEIFIFRLILFIISIALFFCAIIWQKQKGAKWRVAIENDFQLFCEQAGPPAVKSKKFIYFWSVFLVLIYIALIMTIRLSLTYSKADWFKLIAEEDGLWESLTALNLFVSGIIFIIYGIKFRKHFFISKSFIIPVLFGLLFIVAAGEEVSWGEYFLGFKSTKELESVNLQGEFNLHNLGSYWANQMMILFFLAYVGILPLLERFFIDIRYLIDRLCIPTAPLAFFPYGFIGILFDERGFFLKIWGKNFWRVSEAREALFSFIILGTAIFVFLEFKKKLTISDENGGIGTEN